MDLVLNDVAERMQIKHDFVPSSSSLRAVQIRLSEIKSIKYIDFKAIWDERFHKKEKKTSAVDC